MGSTRAGAGGESTGRGADLLTSAADLRWARPDLTAAIADHVLETAALAGDQDRWLAAAAWAVHARAATGDGRETASDVIGQLSRWGRGTLDGPAAQRLRIELAQVAAGAGEVQTARGLLGPVVVDESDPELRADLLAALARCAVEEGTPDRVTEALQAASDAWSAVPGPAAEVGAVLVALVSAVVERRGRRPDAAVEHAADGLARLERSRGDGAGGTPSGHLAAALAAEWISALLDAGRVAEARDGCVPLLPRLAEPARPSRQLALLRLTVARAVATGDGAASSAELLKQAADDAAAADAPDLESVCRTALGALEEKTQPLETALETLRLGVAAERRDRTRTARFRSALAELPPDTLRAAPTPRTPAAPAEASAPTAPPPAAGPAHRARDRATGSASKSSGYDWDAFLREAKARGSATSGGKRRREDREDREDREAVSEAAPGSGSGSSTADGRSGARASGPGARGDDNGRKPSDAELPRRSRRSAEEKPAGAPRSTSRGEDAPEPDAPTVAAESSVPWDDAGGCPIGDGLLRTLRSGEPAATEKGSADRGNGTNGHRARDTAQLREAGAAEPARNGHGRTEPDRGADAAVKPAGSHRRPAADDPPAEPARGVTGWEQSAYSWLSAKLTSPTPSGDDERPFRPRTRDENRWALADVLGSEPRGSRSKPEAESSADALPEAATTGTRPAAGGRRRRPDDAEPAGEQLPAGASADATANRSDGVRSGRDRADAAGEPTLLLPPVRETPATDDPEGWLRSAIADLDRVWGPTGPSGEPPRGGEAPADRPQPAAAAEACTVVVDVARDGRRFAGPRAGAVVRSVADRLTDHLPQGARLKLGESDALSISVASWDRAAATEWMHRTLPGLFAAFDTTEDLPAAQLRAAVHDADGPVGAQILQSLERPAAHRPPPTDRPSTAGRSGRRRAEDRKAPDRNTADPVPQPTEPQGRHGTGRTATTGTTTTSTSTSGTSTSGTAGTAQRHRRDADTAATTSRPARDTENTAAASGPASDDHRADRSTDRDVGPATPAVGSAAGDPPADRSDAGASGAAGGEKAGGTAEATEGLGIADLLAGALAAYRGI